MTNQLKNNFFYVICIFLSSILILGELSVTAQLISGDKLSRDFKNLLNRPLVAPNPSIQLFSTDSVLIERGFFYSEANEKVPIVIYKPILSGMKKLPVVICLHGTGGSKDNAEMKDLLNRFSKQGFIAVSIDGRYHGERRLTVLAGHNNYEEAIIKAWQNKDSSNQQHPFYYDTVYDLWRLVDYLCKRSDMDSSRIGMIGISKGGIETWMAASVDKRIKVAVPAISVQSFRWSLENDRWQGRANTIRSVHEQVAKDRGEKEVNKENVGLLWKKILPGITSEFDCPSMIKLFAPRPLLILNAEMDPNCPLVGAKIAFEAATKSYQQKNALDKLKIDVEPNEPHRFGSRQKEMAIAWFKQWL